MKKKFFAAAVAFVATMSLATSAFAAAPGGTNGSASTEVKVEADKETKFETDKGLTIDAPAGAFEAGADVKMEANIADVAADTTATTVTAPKIEQAIEQIASVSGSEAKVEVNTKIEISLTSGGVAVQPNGKVKVTIAYDGKSNVVCHVNGNDIEFFTLTVNGSTCSFETEHFSDYYMAKVDNTVVEKVVGQKATVKDNGGNNNPGTGVALAVAPAALAVAFVGVTAIVSKKKRG